MEQLRSAIALKGAIESASEKLQPIGTCPQTIWEYKREREYYYEDEDDNDELKALEQIDRLKEAVEGCYWSEFVLGDDDTLRSTGYQIKLGDYVTTTGISQPELEKLYQKGNDSPYGDVENLATKIDKTVRSAKEICNIEVSPDLVSRIEQEWSKKMYPKRVRAVPYKLNMYTKGDKFDEHLDTPDKDLVGTALVNLWSGYIDSGLKISDVNRRRNCYWSPRDPSCIMFYTDCPHEVKECHSTKIRATLAFKIYSVGNEVDCDEQYENIIEALQPILSSGPVGFILEHGYSLETTSFTGADSKLVSALQKMGKRIEVMPILYNFELSSYHNYTESDSFSSNVYPLREVDIEYLSGSPNIEPTCEYRDVQFYIMNNRQFKWKDEHQDYAEHTGNESRPEEQNSIYLSRAVIVH